MEPKSKTQFDAAKKQKSNDPKPPLATPSGPGAS